MWFDSYNYVASKYNFMNHKHLIKLLPKGVFLDTAPLFILVVGHYDKLNNTQFVKRFQSKSKEKNRSYEVYDYNYLLAFLNSCGLGKRYDLFITPHIFTEFVKHLWEIVDNPKHFQKIIETCFKTKWYIKEKLLEHVKIIQEANFLGKRLQIGDVSLIIADNDDNKTFRTILTDDEPFAKIADTQYGFLVIYYNDVRTGTFALDFRNIPNQFLEEPIQIK